MVTFEYSTHASADSARVTVRLDNIDVVADDDFQGTRNRGDRFNSFADVLKNDNCAGGSCSPISIVTPPAHGTAVVVTTRAGTGIQYTIPEGYQTVTQATFTYTTANAENNATVTINITSGNLDTLAADTESIDRIGDAVFSAELDVLANDTCPTGTCTGLSVIAQPGDSATATVNADGTLIVFALDQDDPVVTEWAFTYTTQFAAAPTTVTVNLSSYDTPVADTNSLTRVNLQAVSAIIDVTANDTCVHGCAGVRIITPPSVGSVTVNGNMVTYTIADGVQQVSTDRFDYTTDGAPDSAAVPVTITITS